MIAGPKGNSSYTRQLVFADYSTIACVSLILSLLAALRVFGVDRDYDAYLSFYDDPESKFGDRFEPGFRWLVFSLADKVSDYSVFLFIAALVPLLIKTTLIWKLCRYPFFWISIYSLILYPLHEMTQLRASIALAFAYLSLYCAFDKRYFYACIALLIAGLFHYSTILMSVFIILSSFDRYTRFRVLLLITAGGALTYYLLLFGANFLILDSYFNVNLNDNANIINSRTLTFGALTVLGFFYLKCLSRCARFWYLLSTAGLIIYLFFTDIPVIAHRMFELTIMSYFFWLESLPSKLRLISLTIVTTYAVYFFYKIMFIDIFFYN